MSYVPAQKTILVSSTEGPSDSEKQRSRWLEKEFQKTDTLILCGDALEQLKQLPSESIQMCCTSPPYYNLRDYQTGKWVGGDSECQHTEARNKTRFKRGGADCKQFSNAGSDGAERIWKAVCPKCGAKRIDQQIGLEDTPEAYIKKLVRVFREVRRVLHKSGTLWVNIADSYASTPAGNKTWNHGAIFDGRDMSGHHTARRQSTITGDLKPKDLIGIPWLLAFALRADGWYLRQDIIWCLGGNTWVYTKTDDGGICLMTIKDMHRLKSGVCLWNGTAWVRVLGSSKSKSTGDELEFVLRSGERISCTQNHKFPTDRGLLEARDVRIGDVFKATVLPEPSECKDSSVVNEDAAWFAGLYLAEGSRSNKVVQFSLNKEETHLWKKVESIAKWYGGTACSHIYENTMSVQVCGTMIAAVVESFVSGRSAKDKSATPLLWRYSNKFLKAFLDGYLAGDGHWDKQNNRWRLTFCKNRKLERCLRIICARLGFGITLKPAIYIDGDKTKRGFKGEIRFSRSKHHNAKFKTEVTEIRKSRRMSFYDVGVEGKPHLFATAFGTLTHNSAPNKMPSSVRDRCTTAHEYVFLLSKSRQYFYDAHAIRERSATEPHAPGNAPRDGGIACQSFDGSSIWQNPQRVWGTAFRNRRSVWVINTQPSREKHFASYPRKLVLPCILAGTSEKGCCPKCKAPYVRIIKKKKLKRDRPNDYVKRVPAHEKKNNTPGKTPVGETSSLRATNPCANSVAGVSQKTVGWKPSCECHAGNPMPCTVIDPFSGTGTSGAVAISKNRRAVLIELSPEYVKIIKRKLKRAKAMKGFGL